MAFYESLPGVQPTLIDSPLIIERADTSPRVLVIGTAEKGATLQPTPVVSTGVARSTYGSGGTLLRGIHEVKAEGARNVVALRIGGTPAILAGIGAGTVAEVGYSIETDEADDEAGARFLVWYDASEKRLAVFDNEDGEWVFDSDEVLAGFGSKVTVTLPTTDLTSTTDIGTISAPVAMEDVTTTTLLVYTAGTDGNDCIKTKMWERLYDAYELLDFSSFDIVVPMCVNLDDPNIVDMDAAEITARGLASLASYPTEGSLQDVLGKVFVQEYAGENYFWWDMDGDGVAEIYPSAGAATASTDAFGNAFVSSDFHEVNFGYQLANFCHNATERWQFSLGVISMRSPEGFSLSALSTWIGKAPTFSTNPVTREEYVAAVTDNGSGMLGNKFLAGRYDYRSGIKNGGFIATDTGFLDGEELLDPEENLVDIGKYLSVVGAVAIHTNNFSSAGYISTVASSYAGLIASLPVQSSPSNKILNSVRLVSGRIKASKLDQLAGTRIVSLANKAKGVTITDAPTAARPGSNYRRLTTLRIVKSVVQDIRDASDPFLGEPNSDAQQNALQTILESKVQERVVDGSLRRFDIKISATAQQRVLGQMVVDLVLVPNFETQYILLTINLSAE